MKVAEMSKKIAKLKSRLATLDPPEKTDWQKYRKECKTPADWARKAREVSGMSQLDFAEFLEVTPPRQSLIESGRAKPSHYNGTRYAAITGWPLELFWTEPFQARK